MNITSPISYHRSCLLLFAACAAIPSAHAVTVTAMTGGDVGEGLDLATGQTVVYAVDTFSGAGPVIQGVQFSYATGFAPSTSNTSYGDAVRYANAEYSFNPSFPASNYSATPSADDSALASVFTTINAGSQQWQYNNLTGHDYRLTLLVGLGNGAGGSDNGYVGDFAFKSGDFSNNRPDYSLVLDNFVTLPGAYSYAITYDYTATSSTSSFSLIYDQIYGTDSNGPANAAGAIPLGAWALTEITAVPEPGGVFAGLAISGMVVATCLRRRSALSGLQLASI